VMKKHEALIAALRTDQPHAQVADLFRRTAAFENI